MRQGLIFLVSFSVLSGLGVLPALADGQESVEPSADPAPAGTETPAVDTVEAQPQPQPASESAPLELVDRVVAVVDRDVILHSEMRELVEFVEEQELRGLTGEAREVARGELIARVVDGLIAQRLVDQAMDRAEVGVEDREVEAAVADVASQNGLSVEDLYRQVELQGMDRDSYKLELRDQLRHYKFMNLEIRGRVSVSEQDIQNHYNQRAASAKPDPAWRLQRILLAYPGGSDDTARASVKAEADELLSQIRSGKAFGEIAKLRSDDPSTRELGGDAGLFKPSELAASFSEALEAVPEGEAVLVDTSAGVFLLRVLETLDTAVRPLDELRDSIARELYDKAMDRELERWTAEQRSKAHIELFF